MKNSKTSEKYIEAVIERIDRKSMDIIDLYTYMDNVEIDAENQLFITNQIKILEKEIDEYHDTLTSFCDVDSPEIMDIFEIISEKNWQEKQQEHKKYVDEVEENIDFNEKLLIDRLKIEEAHKMVTLLIEDGFTEEEIDEMIAHREQEEHILHDAIKEVLENMKEYEYE